MELFVQTLKGTKQQFHGIIQMISATKTSFNYLQGLSEL